MAQSVFGTGNLFAIPSGATPTPSRIAALQDVSVDFSFDFKQLYGGAQFAIEQARGKGKIDIKATTGRFDPVLFNTVVFGLTSTAGETLNSVDESGTIPGTPYQVTVVNSATWSVDLGVYDTTAKKYLTRVSSGPATGQYSVSAGVYSFATADTTHQVRISYTYTSSATGSKLAYTNQLLGANVVFGLELVNSFTGSDGVKRSMLLHFPAVQCPKLSMPLKLDDFSLPQLEMHAQDDGAGNVFDYSFTG